MTAAPDITFTWPKNGNATFFGKSDKGKSIIKDAKSAFSWVLLSGPCSRYGLTPHDIEAPNTVAADVLRWLEEQGACVEDEHKLEYCYDKDGSLLAAFSS